MRAASLRGPPACRINRLVCSLVMAVIRSTDVDRLQRSVVYKIVINNLQLRVDSNELLHVCSIHTSREALVAERGQSASTAGVGPGWCLKA